MPPEVPYCRSLVTPLVRSSSPISPEAIQLLSSQKYCQRTKKMNFTKKKIIPFLVIILAIISILRLLRITVTSYSSSPPLPTFPSPLQEAHSSPSPACTQVPSHASESKIKFLRTFSNASVLTEKEFQLLFNLVIHKAPCNILIFGLEPEYLFLSSINAGGTTIFLEDDPEKLNLRKPKFNTTRIYKVEYEAHGI